MAPAVDFSLYAILDVAVLADLRLSLEEAAEWCAEGGARVVQLRDKTASSRRLFDEAARLVAITRRLDVLAIVNDRADVALAAGADGVHVGRDDLPVAAARRVLGPTAIVGATARSLDEALAAQAEGAAYVGVGSLYASRTKEAPLMTPATAGEIARSLRVPVVAIGGIDEVGAAKLSGMGLAGVAVCRALFEDRNEVTAAARRIRDAFLGAAAK